MVPTLTITVKPIFPGSVLVPKNKSVEFENWNQKELKKVGSKKHGLAARFKGATKTNEVGSNPFIGLFIELSAIFLVLIKVH
jgi:hypothetical protein